MTTLIDYTVTHIVRHPQAGSYPASFNFYLLPQGAVMCCDVPIGGSLGLVSSPSRYNQKDRQDTWMYTRFEVVEHKDLRSGEMCQGYRVTGHRELTALEQAHFEALAMGLERAA